MSLEQLAKALGTGFTAGVLSMMEGRRLRPTPRQGRRLSEVFGLEAEVLLEPVEPIIGLSLLKGTPT
jgi:hypothetical protein